MSLQAQLHEERCVMEAQRKHFMRRVANHQNKEQGRTFELQMAGLFDIAQYYDVDYGTVLAWVSMGQRPKGWADLLYLIVEFGWEFG